MKLDKRKRLAAQVGRHVLFVGSVRKLRNYGGWTLQKRTRSARMGGVRVEAQLDLGGIAKGFAADVARRIVADAGFEFGYYSSESSICLLGCASGEAVRRRARDHNVYLTDPWANPRRPVHYLMTRASGCTVSTSGSYVRSYACDGVTFSHVVNPRTGLPAAVGRDGRGGYEQLPGVVTASVIGPDATMGDALATALCMMEPREAVAFYNERLRNEWHVVLVTSEGQGAGGARQRILTSLPREDYYLYGRRYPVASRVDHGRIAVVDED